MALRINVESLCSFSPRSRSRSACCVVRPLGGRVPVSLLEDFYGIFQADGYAKDADRHRPYPYWLLVPCEGGV